MQTRPFTKLDPDCVQDVLQKNYGLRTIAKKTNLIQSASEILAQVLPEDLIKHCFVANLQHGLITLAADSATWSTHLRYYHQAILKALQNSSDFNHVHSIRLRLARRQVKKQQPDRTPTMSQAVSDTIMASANSVTNSKLKQALQKLASNAKR